jgi:hypothetical protein
MIILLKKNWGKGYQVSQGIFCVQGRWGVVQGGPFPS